MSKMAPKWPFRARQGDILGHFGPFWSSGTNKTHNCALYCVRPVFVLCWLDFRQFGRLGCFWGPVEHFWSLLPPWEPFLDLVATIWAYPEHFLDLLVTIWAYFGGNGPPTRKYMPCLGFFFFLDSIWVSAGGKLPPFLSPFWTFW